MRKALAVVLLVTLAVFAVGITGGHLGLDDWSYTGGCPFVRDGLSVANIRAAFTSFAYCAIWMPLTFLTYMADVSLFGGGWTVHHATNVAFHGVTAVVVFLFLRMLLRRLTNGGAASGDWVCALAALVWALHPLRAEAVTFVASRKEELWTLFSLLGLMAWMRFLDGGGWRFYALAFGAFILSCLSKPTAVCFPLLACLLQVVLPARREGTPQTFRLVPILPMLGVSLAVGWLAAWAQAHPTGMVSADVLPATAGWRLLNAAVSLGLYIWHTLVPTGCHFDYRAVFGGWPVEGGLGLVVLGAVTLVLLVGLLRSKSRSVRRVLVLSTLWFGLGLLPTLGVFGYVNGDQACADRYAYLPAIAFSIPLAFALARFGRPAVVACLILLGAEACYTLTVIRSFENDGTTYSRVLACDPDHWRALRVVGNECCARKGRMDEGVRLLRRSLRLRGSQQTADSLAYVLAIRGQPGDFAEVKRLAAPFVRDPRRDRHGLMLDAAAIVSFREGDDAAAVRLFTASLAVLRRNHSRGHSLLNLGLALANVGRDSEAEAALARALREESPDVRSRAREALAKIRSGAARSRFVWR